MNRKILLLALSAALLPGLAGAEDKTTVYRTVNADGTVTYSQIESDGARSQVVDGRDPRTEDGSAPAAASADESAAAGSGTPEQQACKSATDAMALLNSGQRLLRKGENGEPDAAMTDEQVAAEKVSVQKQIDAFCS